MIIIKIKKHSLYFGLYIFPFIPILLSDSLLYYNALSYFKIFLGFLGFVIGLNSMRFMVKEKTVWGLFSLSFLIPYFINQQVSFSDFVLKIYPIGCFIAICTFCLIDFNSVLKILYRSSFLIVILYYLIFLFQIGSGKIGNPILYNNDNAAQIYFSFVIYSILFYCENTEAGKMKIKDKVAVGAAFLGIVLTGSVTGIFCALIGILVILGYKKIDIYKISISYVVVFVILVVLHATNIPIIKAILGFFQKSDTFTNRYWRWMFSTQNIKDHLLFGDCNIEPKASLYANYYVEYFNPHNALLYVVLFGGLISLLFLIVIMLSVSNCKTRSFLVSFSMMCVTGMMESNFTPTSFVLLIVFITTCYSLKYNSLYTYKNANKIVVNNT